MEKNSGNKKHDEPPPLPSLTGGEAKNEVDVKN
jgi:hypothetical protein